MVADSAIEMIRIDFWFLETARIKCAILQNCRQCLGKRKDAGKYNTVNVSNLAQFYFFKAFFNLNSRSIGTSYNSIKVEKIHGLLLDRYCKKTHFS